MPTVWWRRALQQRLGTLAAAALMLWIGITTIAASVATNRVADGLLSERAVVARHIAARVDSLLNATLRQLDLVAASSASDDAVSLANDIRRLPLSDAVLRVAPDGHVIWARSVPDARVVSPLVGRLAPPAHSGWKATTTSVIATPLGPRAFLVLPARDSDPIGGAVAAAIDFASPGLHDLIASYAADPYRVLLVDAAGVPVTNATRRTATAAKSDSSELIATAPIANSGWRVELVQARSAALAPVLRLRAVLVGSSLVLLPFAVVAALATARSIRRPVLDLTTAAEQLAYGNLSTPIPPEGDDEIGRLALALERLRRALEGDERRSVLLKRVIDAQEEERRRIARELHDETTQQLTVLGMQLDAACTDDARVAAALAAPRRLVCTINDGLHGIIHGLRPSILDDLGLLPAIRSYAETHLAAHGVDVHYEFSEVDAAVSRDATTALYRVAQEAMTNIERHAHASAVMIGCTIAGSELVLEIEDDGVGFEPARQTRPRDTGQGLGLLGMHERLALLGGRLEVESEPNGGTRIVARMPMEHGVENNSQVPSPKSQIPTGAAVA